MKPTLFFAIASIGIAALTASCGPNPAVAQAAPPSIKAPTKVKKASKKTVKVPAKEVAEPTVKPEPKPNWPEPAPIETKNIPEGESSLRHKTTDQPLTR